MHCGWILLLLIYHWLFLYTPVPFFWRTLKIVPSPLVCPFFFPLLFSPFLFGDIRSFDDQFYNSHWFFSYSLLLTSTFGFQMLFGCLILLCSIAKTTQLFSCTGKLFIIHTTSMIDMSVAFFQEQLTATAKRTYWCGKDLPGHQLSLVYHWRRWWVVIDRLPRYSSTPRSPPTSISFSIFVPNFLL